jgi:hypothetical protein
VTLRLSATLGTSETGSVKFVVQGLTSGGGGGGGGGSVTKNPSSFFLLGML